MSNRKSKTVSELLQDATATEHDEMLDRLMRQRGIEAGDYKSLARELAIKHVPGFRRVRFRLEHVSYGKVIRDNGKGGRPTKWTQEELDKLVNAVADAKEKYGLATDEEALRYITKQGKWDHDDRTKLRKTLKNKLAAERRARRVLIC
jgi:hypothetical protein